MKIIKTLLLPAALPLLLQLVHATPSTAIGFIAATGFTITGASFADGNTFMTITVTTMLTGTLSGTGVDLASLLVHSDGTFNAQHLSTCTCSFDGQSGTLNSIFNLKGSMVTRVAIGQWTILSGTGGLSTLRGQGTLNGAPFVGADYSLQIHFEP